MPEPKPEFERLDVENDDARQRRVQNLLEGLDTSDTAFVPQPRPSGLAKFDFGDRSTAPFTPNSDLLSRVQAFLPQLEASNRELLERARVDPGSVDIECVEEEEGKEGRGYIEMNLGLGVFEQKRAQKHKQKGKTKGKGKGKAAGGDADGDEEMDASSSSSSSGSSGSSSDSSSDSDSDSTDSSDDEDDGDPTDPLTAFFASLRHGQTLSMDSSDEDGSGSSGDEGEGDGGEGDKREREVKPLPRRARPVIEVIGEGEGERAATGAEGEAEGRAGGG